MGGGGDGRAREGLPVVLLADSFRDAWITVGECENTIANLKA